MVHQGLRVCEECRRVRGSREEGGLRVYTKGNPRVRKEGAVGGRGFGGVAVRHGDTAAAAA